MNQVITAVEHELITISQLMASMRTRIDMIATTQAEQRSKDRDLKVWTARIDEAVTRAIKANR